MIKDIRCLRWTPRWRRWLATAGTTSSSMVSRFKRVRDKITVVILIILFYHRLIILIHGLPVQEGQRPEKKPLFSFHLYRHGCLPVQEGLTPPTTIIVVLLIILSFWIYFHSDYIFILIILILSILSSCLSDYIFILTILSYILLIFLIHSHIDHNQCWLSYHLVLSSSYHPSWFIISWSKRVIMNISWFKRIDFVAHNHPCHPYHPCHLQQGPNTSHFRRMHGVLGKHHGRHCTHKAWGSQVPICWLFLSFFLFICLASFIPIVDFCSFVFCWKRRTDEWRWLQGGYVGQHLPLDADKIRGALISLNRNLQCLLLLFNFDLKRRSVDEIINC